MIRVHDPHSLFSIVEQHVIQHLFNIDLAHQLSKILHVDNPNSNSIALSISTDPTESSIADLLIIKCETTKEYNKSVREIIKSWLKRIETDYYVILCLTGFGMRTKKSASFYRTMSKDFYVEAAGDSTSLVNA